MIEEKISADTKYFILSKKIDIFLVFSKSVFLFIKCIWCYVFLGA